MTAAETDDEQVIRQLIGGHFEGLRWSPTSDPDWARFSADFLPDAIFIPAARPATIKNLEQFIQRMEGVAKGSLHTFEEHTRGMQILRFGDVAVVMASSEMIENGTEINHDVSGYLVVKSEGKWLIAAHAWQPASASRPVPDSLL